MISETKAIKTYGKRKRTIEYTASTNNLWSSTRTDSHSLLVPLTSLLPTRSEDPKSSILNLEESISILKQESPSNCAELYNKKKENIEISYNTSRDIGTHTNNCVSFAESAAHKYQKTLESKHVSPLDPNSPELASFSTFTPFNFSEKLEKSRSLFFYKKPYSLQECIPKKPKKTFLKSVSKKIPQSNQTQIIHFSENERTQPPALETFFFDLKHTKLQNIKWPRTKISYESAKLSLDSVIVDIQSKYCLYGEKIAKINCNSPKSLLIRAIDALNVANEELGAAKHCFSDFENSSKTIFLYISKNRKIIGCLLVEPILPSSKIFVKPRNSCALVEQLEMTQTIRPCNITSNSADLQDSRRQLKKYPICGVSRIWTTKNERRRKISTMLIEALQNHFIYGTYINSSLIAFSQTTQDGDSFATSITNQNWYYIYSE